MTANNMAAATPAGDKDATATVEGLTETRETVAIDVEEKETEVKKVFATRDFFDEMTDAAGVKKRVCKKAKCSASYSMNTSTSVLKRHASECSAGQGRALNVFAPTIKVEGGLQNWIGEVSQEKITNALIEMFISLQLPFTLASAKSFKQYSQMLVLARTYQVPNRKTISKKIKEMFEKKKLEMKEYLKSIQSLMSITFDSWTSLNTIPYVCFTIHFVDNEWEKKDLILDFVRFPYPHKSEDYNRICQDFLDSWELDGHLIAGLTDNEAATTKGHEMFAKVYNERNDLKNSPCEYRPMRCAIHTLQLPIKEVFVELKDRVSKASRWATSSRPSVSL